MRLARHARGRGCPQSTYVLLAAHTLPLARNERRMQRDQATTTPPPQKCKTSRQQQQTPARQHQKMRCQSLLVVVFRHSHLRAPPPRPVPWASTATLPPPRLPATTAAPPVPGRAAPKGTEHHRYEGAAARGRTSAATGTCLGMTLCMPRPVGSAGRRRGERASAAAPATPGNRGGGGGAGTMHRAGGRAPRTWTAFSSFSCTFWISASCRFRLYGRTGGAWRERGLHAQSKMLQAAARNAATASWLALQAVRQRRTPMQWQEAEGGRLGTASRPADGTHAHQPRHMPRFSVPACLPGQPRNASQGQHILNITCQGRGHAHPFWRRPCL